MRKNSIKISLLAILLALSTITVLQNSAFAQGPPNIYVSDQFPTGSSNFIFYTNTTTVGHRFNVTININNGSDVYSWQVKLNYNSTLLNATRGWVPSTDSQYIFFGSSEFAPPINFQNGSVLAGSTLLTIAGVTFTAPKKLAIIEFQIMAAPPPGTGSKLSSLLDIDIPADTFLLDSTTAEIPIIRTSGYYEFDFVPFPSEISISASPTTAPLGANVTISGLISTPLNASVMFPGEPVTIWERLGTSGTFNNLTTVATNSSSFYYYNWTSSVMGTHQFKASWPGNGIYSGNESAIISVDVGKTPTTITISATPTTAYPTQTVIVTGSISSSSPGQFVNINVTIWHRINVTSTFANFTRLRTNSASVYNFTVIAGNVGLHQFYATWEGNATYARATSSTVNVTVNILTSTATIKIDRTTVNTNRVATISGNITLSPINPRIAGRFLVTIWTRLGTSGTWTNLTATTVTTTLGVNQYAYGWTAIEPAGVRQFMASYSGDSNFTAFQTSVVQVTVVIPPRPVISIGNFVFFTNTTVVGSRFNATITINNGTNVAAWQVGVRYNATLLNVTRAFIPATDLQYIFFNIPTFTPPIIRDIGSLVAGETTNPVIGVNFTTPKKLLIVEFEVLAVPSGIGNKVRSVLNINNTDTVTNFLDPDGLIISVIASDGSYELGYAPPTGLITMTAFPSTVSIGTNVILNGTIYTVSNLSVTFPNVRVTIWHRAGTSGAFTNLTTVLTTTASKYTYTWASVAPNGTHQFQAQWTGNSLYVGSRSAITNVTVNKITATITLETSTASAETGQSVTLNGQLTPVIAGATITILVNSTTTLTTVTTDASGKFIYIWTPNATGTYVLTARYSGDATRSSAVSTPAVTVTVTAAAGTPWIYYIIAIVVIIVIIAVIVYYLRRRSREEEEQK